MTMTLATLIRVTGFSMVGLAFYGAGASVAESVVGIFGVAFVMAASQ